MNSNKVSFVILTWNRNSMLKVCLDKLYNAIEDKNNAEIIIFDNASDDNTHLVIENFHSQYKNNIEIKYVISNKNLRLNAYKQLFKMAEGDIIIEVDDDVLDFPCSVDKIFIKYLDSFPKFGFLALDVIQNEYTNGAKPSDDYYTTVEASGLIVQQGPTGGWCSGFRRSDFRYVSWLFNLLPISMKLGEDTVLQRLFQILGKRSGIIKNQKCFHATGPYYSKKFKQIERDVEKYQVSGLTDFVEIYKNSDKKDN